MCNQKLILEALSVGVIFIVMTYLMEQLRKTLKMKINKQIFIGLIGVVSHLLLEYSGVNKYYCQHGNACL